MKIQNYWKTFAERAKKEEQWEEFKIAVGTVIAFIITIVTSLGIMVLFSVL